MSLLGENMASKGEHTYPVKALWRHPYNWATVSVAAVNIYAAAWFFLKGPSFSAPRSRVAWILWKLFVGVRLTSLHSPLRPDTHSEGLCATRTLVVLVLASDRKPNFRLSPLYTWVLNSCRGGVQDRGVYEIPSFARPSREPNSVPNSLPSTRPGVGPRKVSGCGTRAGSRSFFTFCVAPVTGSAVSSAYVGQLATLWNRVHRVAVGWEFLQKSSCGRLWPRSLHIWRQIQVFQSFNRYDQSVHLGGHESRMGRARHFLDCRLGWGARATAVA